MTGDIRLIDTHLHLHLAQFDADREQAITRRAGAAGRTAGRSWLRSGVISRGAGAGRWRTRRSTLLSAFSRTMPRMAGAEWLAEIRRLAAHPKAVAIGEIGLDYYHDRAPHDAQERLFREQLALARELELPVVIHSREAQADTVRILRDAARGQPGIMHSFSGDWAYAEACLEVGFQLSFSGPVTFAKATELHEVARRTPLDRILTETDSPYLAPHPLRGKRNEPANVRLVAERLAALREIDAGRSWRGGVGECGEIFGLSNITETYGGSA